MSVNAGTTSSVPMVEMPEKVVETAEEAERPTWSIMDRGVLFATDILVWVQRGSERAAKTVDEQPLRRISIITYMEMIQATTNRIEKAYVRSFLETFRFLVLPVTEVIGHRAVIYVEQYPVSIGDALIVATAVENCLPMFTCDANGFAAIAGLELRVVSP